MSEQANQLHNPPVMFNKREITFYTFLHSCDKHAVFFVCVGVIGISIIIVSCGFGSKTIHSCRGFVTADVLEKGLSHGAIATG